jgi:hypothetical protein
MATRVWASWSSIRVAYWVEKVCEVVELVGEVAEAAGDLVGWGVGGEGGDFFADFAGDENELVSHDVSLFFIDVHVCMLTPL